MGVLRFLIATFLLVPFFSSADIFTDGSVDTKSPSIVDNFTAECRAGFAVIKINKTFEQQYDSTKHAQYYEACASDPDLQDVHFNYMKANYHIDGCTFSKAGVVLNGFNSQIKVHRECWSAATTNTWSHGLGFTKLSDSSGASCPPDEYPTYNFPLDFDSDGEVDACADPAQIATVDSCSINSILPEPTGGATGSICVPKSDGSMCGYDAASDGMSYSASNADCYTTELPELEPSSLPEPPPLSGCSQLGDNTLLCSANSDDVCTESGAVIDGITAISCKSGCGIMTSPQGNDYFGCIGTDTDGDGEINFPEDTASDGSGTGDSGTGDGSGTGDSGTGDGSGTGDSGTGDSSGTGGETQIAGISESAAQALSAPINSQLQNMMNAQAAQSEDLITVINDIKNGNSSENRNLVDIKAKSAETAQSVNVIESLMSTEWPKAQEEQKAATKETTAEVKATNEKLEAQTQIINLNNKYLRDLEQGVNHTSVQLNQAPTEGAHSFYESEYPDGLKGIWDETQEKFKATAAFSFVESFRFTGSGDLPVWSIDFDLGAMGDLGTYTIEFDNWIITFVRIVMLYSAAMLCRRLIFGG